MSGANDILEQLDLSWNQLRRRGAVAIAKGIKVHTRHQLLMNFISLPTPPEQITQT